MDQNPDRTVPEEYLPLAEAAQRLGIAYDTARKRLKAGTLEGERRGGRWYVLVPGPESRPEGGQEAKPNQPGEQSEDSGHIPEDTEPIPDALVAALQDEIVFLRQQLDHQTHIIAGLVQRLPDLQALPEPQDAQNAPGRVDPHEMTADTLQGSRGVPVPASEGLWQRLWRAISGR